MPPDAPTAQPPPAPVPTAHARDDPRGAPSPPGPRRTSRSYWIGLAVVLLLAVGVRLAYVGILQDTPFEDERGLLADVEYYDLRAREIAGGDLVGDWAAYLSPLQCFALGGVYAVAGPSVTAGKLFQVLLGGLSCVLLAAVGRRVFSVPVGLMAGAMLALYGPHVYYTGLLLPATLVVFTNLLALWAACVAGARPSLARWLATGAFVGLAIGAKANALLLLPAFAAWILWRHRDLGWLRRAGLAGALTAGATLTVAPITYRNYLASGELVLVTTTGGLNLLKGLGPQATGTHVGLVGVENTSLREFIRGEVIPEQAAREDARLSEMAWTYARENPGHVVRLGLIKLGLFLDQRELGIRDQIPVAKELYPMLRWLIPFWLVVPLGLAGMLFALRRGPDAPLVYLMLGTQVASFVLIFVLARYRLVAVACFMLLAAWLLERAWQAWRRREVKPFALGLPAVGVATAIVVLPVPGFEVEPKMADQYFFIGNHAYEHERYEDAVDYYMAALQSEWQFRSEIMQLSLRLADSLVCLDRLADARVVYERVIEQLRASPAPQYATMQEKIEIILADMDKRGIRVPPR